MSSKSVFCSTFALVGLFGLAVACSETAESASSSSGGSSGENISSSGAASGDKGGSSGNGSSSGKNGSSGNGSSSSGSGENPDFALVWNEIASSDDFVELYNPTSEAVDVSGYIVVDLDPDSNGPKPDGDEDRLVLAEGTVVAPGAYLTIVADSKTPSPTPVPCFETLQCPAAKFGLSKSGVDAVFLLDAEGNEVLRVDLPLSPDDAGTPALAETESWGRFPNATGAFGVRTTRTPGRANE